YERRALTRRRAAVRAFEAHQPAGGRENEPKPERPAAVSRENEPIRDAPILPARENEPNSTAGVVAAASESEDPQVRRPGGRPRAAGATRRTSFPLACAAGIRASQRVNRARARGGGLRRRGLHFGGKRRSLRWRQGDFAHMTE